MAGHLQHAIDCLQRQIETSEHNASILDVEGRHDDAFAARELAASLQLAVGLLLLGQSPERTDSAHDETIACPQPDPAPTVQEPPPRYLQLRLSWSATGPMTFDFVPYRDTSEVEGWTSPETAKVTHSAQAAVAQGAKLFADISAGWVRIHVTTGGAPTTTASSNPDHD